jgi:hypothetical protein
MTDDRPGGLIATKKRRTSISEQEQMSTNGAFVSLANRRRFLYSAHMPVHAGLFPDAVLRRRIPHYLGMVSVILLTAACSTGKEAAMAPRIRLDQQTVAVMTAVNVEEAERLRLSLLRGQPPPPSAHLVSIEELVRSDPALGKLAAQLMDCEISRPIPPPTPSTNAQTSTGYLVLQRGGDPDQPCHGEPSMGDQMVQWSDMAGELLIGLLAIGVTGFLAAAPFIFHIF